MSETTEPLRPSLSAQLAGTLSLDNNRLFSVALLLCIAPLWFGPYLPMVDLPQHAGQIAALQRILQGDPTFTQLFEINWFTPYLIGYLLLYGVALVLPITIATKLLVSLSILSLPILTGVLLRNAGADERWKWLAIPGSYSFAFYWGFLSYMVAVSVALLFLIHTIRFARQPTLASGIATAAFAVFLFFCHVVVLAVASLLALAYIAALHYRDPRAVLVRALPYAAPVPLIGVWLLTTHANEAAVQKAPILFGPLQRRFSELVVQPSGLEHFSIYLSIAVTGAILLAPRLCGATFSRRPERWLPLVIGLVLFLTVPDYASNTGFLYQRLGIFLVPLWLICWDRPAGSPRRLDWAVMLLVVGWVFVNAGRFAAFARETESFDQVAAHLPPGRRVAAMIAEHRSPLFAAPVYLHFPSWYQATRGGIVDFNFADFHPQIVRYRNRSEPRISEGLGWYPTYFVWEAHGGDKYDYFIVKSNTDIAAALFKEKTPAVRLVAQKDWWWLYQNMERGRAQPSAAE